MLACIIDWSKAVKQLENRVMAEVVLSLLTKVSTTDLHTAFKGDDALITALIANPQKALKQRSHTYYCRSGKRIGCRLCFFR